MLVVVSKREEKGAEPWRRFSSLPGDGSGGTACCATARDLDYAIRRASACGWRAARQLGPGPRVDLFKRLFGGRGGTNDGN
jgi:hypothetical protein